MAEYRVTVTASDSWQDHYVEEEKTNTVRGASFLPSVDFAFTTSHPNYAYGWKTADFCQFYYTLPTQYKKKELSRVEQYAYVTSYSSTASGALDQGSFVFNCDGELQDYFNTNYYEYRPLGDLVKNQYNKIAQDTPKYFEKVFQNGYWIGGAGVDAGTTGWLKSYTSYTAKGNFALQSHTGANPPYAVFVYEDVVPRASDCAPRSGFVDEKVENTFRWSFFYEKSDGIEQALHQKAYQFRWRVKDGETYSEITEQTERPSHTVAANTFPINGAFEWCVRVQSDDEVWSDWSSWMLITTVDSLSKPADLSPDMVYVNGNEEQIFSWKHVIATGSPQSKFQLQIFDDTLQEWTDLKAGVTSHTYTGVPANTLASGDLRWRVRTGNSDDIYGEWSEQATAVVRSKPVAPDWGRIDAVPKAVLRWQAADQQGYQVKIGSIGSGQRYGEEKEWECPGYLEDGTYRAMVRVQNEFGLWSDWSEVSVPIANENSGTMKIFSRIQGYGIVLTWDQVKDATGYQVNRDGSLIGTSNACQFTDWLCTGKHSYQILAMMPGGMYQKSQKCTEIFSMKNAAIADLSTLDWLPLCLKEQSLPIHKMESEAQVRYQQYYGDALPVAEIAQGESRRHQLSFSFPENQGLERIKNLVGKPVLYKDQWGSSILGVLESLQASYKANTQVDFVLCETLGGDVDAW